MCGGFVKSNMSFEGGGSSAAAAAVAAGNSGAGDAEGLCFRCFSPTIFTLCSAQHAECAECALGDIASQGADLLAQGEEAGRCYYPANARTLSFAEGVKLPLPGLLCPQCLASPDERGSYAHLFWKAASRVGAAPPPVALAPPFSPAGFLPGWVTPASFEALLRDRPGALKPAALASAIDAHFLLLEVARPDWCGAAGEGGALSPQPRVLVKCPTEGCSASFSLGVHPAPFHVTCAACGEGLCGCCGKSWTLAGEYTSHATRTCLEQGAVASSAKLLSLPPLDEVGGTASKRCPGCGTAFFRPRGASFSPSPLVLHPLSIFASLALYYPLPLPLPAPLFFFFTACAHNVLVCRACLPQSDLPSPHLSSALLLLLP